MSDHAAQVLASLETFMVEHVYPAEPVYAAQRAELAAAGEPHTLPPVVEELKAAARERGLWNLFLPDVSGLSVREYAPIAELTGRSVELAPEALNCSAPDTGNMELLHLFGTPEQKQQWLEPLLAGEIRSGFGMTEPGVASSDARNIQTSDPARRRRVRHRRPEVVDDRDGRPTVCGAHRDGTHRPGRRPLSPAVDGAGPAGHSRRHGAAFAAGVRLRGPARPRRGAVRGCPGAGRRTSSAGRVRASGWRRNGWGQAGSTTACGRSGWLSGPSS